jgi:oligopeptide/dipeptide ABC transporter ATP-binding protein
MADRVAVMYGGRVVEEGPVAGVFKTPAHPYTRGLLACLPGVGEGRRLTAIAGTVPSLGQFPRGCSFAPRCGDRMDVCDVTPPGVTELPQAHAASPLGGRTVRCYLHGSVTGEPT